MVRLQLMTTGGCFLPFVSSHWLNILSWLDLYLTFILSFIQPAAARLLFSFFFFFHPRICCHIPFLPPASAPLWVTQCVWVPTAVCLCWVTCCAANQPTLFPTDLLVSNREMNMSHWAKPSCHVFSEAENEIQEKKPTPQKIQKKRKKERAMMSVFPPAGPPPNTPFQPQYFIVKLCIFSTGLSPCGSPDLIWFSFFWGGGSVLHPAVIYISDTHSVGKRQTIKQLRVSALTCCFPEVKTRSAWLWVVSGKALFDNPKVTSCGWN